MEREIRCVEVEKGSVRGGGGEKGGRGGKGGGREGGREEEREGEKRKGERGRKGGRKGEKKEGEREGGSESTVWCEEHTNPGLIMFSKLNTGVCPINENVFVPLLFIPLLCFHLGYSCIKHINLPKEYIVVYKTVTV